MGNKKIYIVTRIRERGDITESDVMMAFSVYENAEKYVSLRPDIHKYSTNYEIEEIEIGD